MPSDVVTIAVSTGIGISVIAGVLSGMCYILVQGFKRKRSQEQAPGWQCFVCGTWLRPCFRDDTRTALCLQCEERVCKIRCSKRIHNRKGWICLKCLRKASWLRDTYNDVCSKYKKMLEIKNQKIDRVNTEKINNSIIHMQKKDHIRDFIENLVSVILGENVDDASVFRVHVHKQYNRLFEKYYRDLCHAITNLGAALHVSMTDIPFAIPSPSTAHSNLKEILENLVRDASEIPEINDISENSTSDHKQQTYEELLAAAILNKVINKYQDNLSTVSTDNSLRSDSILSDDNVEHFHRKAELEDKWNSEDFETNSNSSLDENLPTDIYSSKYIDRVSLTIQRQVEELYPKVEENIKKNNEIPEENDTFLDDSSNWYMQERLFHSSQSSLPVPMVVPNPLSSSKVLIGEKEADDTSDLSDNESELIKPTLDSADEEISTDSGIKDERDGKAKFFTRQKTNLNVNDEDKNVSLISYENTDNKLEYLTEYSSLPKTVFKSVSSIQTFGRDYYLRQASLPSGRKKTHENHIEEWSPADSLEEQDTVDAKTENGKFDFENDFSLKSDKISDDIDEYKPYTEEKPENLNITIDPEFSFQASKMKFEQTSPQKDANDNYDFTKRYNTTHEDKEIISSTNIWNIEPAKTTDVKKEINQLEKKENDVNKTLLNDDTEKKPVTVSKKCDNVLTEKHFSSPLISISLVNKIDTTVKPDNTTKMNETTTLSLEPQKTDFEFSSISTDLENENENNNHNQFPNNNNLDSSNTFSLEFSDNETQQTPRIYKEDEYNELKGKRLVANRINDFSKSFPNLMKASWNIRKEKESNKTKSTEHLEKPDEDDAPSEDTFVSVKNLKKLFENNGSSSKKDQPVHSLTARSIPKKLKDNLKSFGTD